LFDNWRKDEQRGIFPPDEDDFSQAYGMYVKKNQQSMAEKDPLMGVLTIFKQTLEGRPNGRPSPGLLSLR